MLSTKPRFSDDRMNIRHLIFCFLSLLLPLQLMAQQQGRTVSGRLLDAENGAPLEVASVSLLRAQDSSHVRTSLTDMQGRFSLQVPAQGRFLLRIHLIGYQTSVRPLPASDELGTIKVAPDAKLLKQVTVTATPDFQSKTADGVRYNLGAGGTDTGGSLLDAMEGLPLITMDDEQNVSVMGKTKIGFWLNDAPSEVPLKYIPADIIESVEVITNPPAKYGSKHDVIIHIRTKKDPDAAISGGGGASVGTRDKYDGNLFMNYVKVPSTFIMGSLGYRDQSRYSNMDRLTQQRQGQDTTYQEQQTWGDNRNQGVQASLNANLGLGKGGKHKLSANTNLSPWQRSLNTQLSRTRTTDALQEQTLALLEKYSLNDNESRDFSQSFNYQAPMKREGQELSATFSASYNQAEGQQRIDQQNLLHPESAPTSQHIDNSSENTSVAMQVFHGYPLSPQLTLSTNMQYRYSASNSSMINSMSTPEHNMDSRYRMYEHVVGGTLGLRLKLEKWRIGQLFDVEYTDRSVTQNGRHTPNRYTNILPRTNVMFDLSEQQRLSWDYRMYVQRPSAEMLDPTIDYSNPLSISYGNPNLDPSFTHTFDMGYMLNGEKHNFSANASYNLTLDAIQRISFLDEDGVLNNTYKNMDYSSSLMLRLSERVDVTDWLNLRGGFNISHTSTVQPLEAGGETRLDNTTWDANLNARFNLFNKKLSLSLMANYEAPRENFQGYYDQVFYMNFFARYRFDALGGRSVLYLRGQDIFNQRGKVFQRLERSNATTWQYPDRETQIFTVGLRYFFFSGKAKQVMQKSMQQRSGGRQGRPEGPPPGGPGGGPGGEGKR